MLDFVRTCCHVIRTSRRNFPNNVDCWNPTLCRIGEAWPSIRTVLLWHLDVFSAKSSRHCGAFGRLQRPIRTVVQEPAVLTWKFHEIFMDIFLETCDHTHGIKWDTVHITRRLWIEPIILLKSNRYIKCFCQPECCQYKILTRCIFAYDMCSTAHWLLYSAVRCNSDYHVHVMGHVSYVDWATCSRATVKIHLYVFKKKKKGVVTGSWFVSWTRHYGTLCNF
jgi:hypothetical protein